MNSSLEREEKPFVKLSQVNCFLSGALLPGYYRFLNHRFKETSSLFHRKGQKDESMEVKPEVESEM